MKIGNLFEDADAPVEGERFDPLLRHKNLTIERIVSSLRPEMIEYKQEQDEWVALLRGEASLKVNGQLLELKAGDHLFLPAGTPHSVKSTSHGALWIAVHLHPSKP
ncbi:MAG: Cupin 2 conserved barrel domain protein [Chthoniobacteraceae bacterium]|nr:Cupin 2 conserved barrel domain protein [Chthoniobacteraceae bacterium]